MAAGDGGLIGNGVKVGWRTATSPLEPWNEIGQIMEATGLNLEADTVDSDVHSTSRFKRNMPGKIAVAPMVLKLLQNPNPAAGEGAVQTQLFNLLTSGETVSWRVEKPTNRNQSLYFGREFDGWVKAFNEEQPIKEGQVVTVTIEFDDDSFTRDAAAGASEM